MDSRRGCHLCCDGRSCAQASSATVRHLISCCTALVCNTHSRRACPRTFVCCRKMRYGKEWSNMEKASGKKYLRVLLCSILVPRSHTFSHITRPSYSFHASHARKLSPSCSHVGISTWAREIQGRNGLAASRPLTRCADDRWTSRTSGVTCRRRRYEDNLQKKAFST